MAFHDNTRMQQYFQFFDSNSVYLNQIRTNNAEKCGLKQVRNSIVFQNIAITQ